MFGLFGKGNKRFKRIQALFEDTKNRVLFRMNSYEQYSFGSVFDHIPIEVINAVKSTPKHDKRACKTLARQLEGLARDGYLHHEQIGGIAGEGGKAGADGPMLLAIETEIWCFDTPEAAHLRKETIRFRKFVNQFVTSEDYKNEPIPTN